MLGLCFLCKYRTLTLFFNFYQYIETKNYYLAVEPIPKQIANMTNNFQNKSSYPKEIFLP